jgi:hypothetical protein
VKTGPIGERFADAAAELVIRLAGGPAGAGLALAFTQAEVDASFGGLVVLTLHERGGEPHTIALALRRFRAEPDDRIPILGAGSAATPGGKPSEAAMPDCPAAASLAAGIWSQGEDAILTAGAAIEKRRTDAGSNDQKQ